MFREVASFLVQIRSQFVGSTLNLKGSLKEFSDVEEILKLEASEFEVGFLLFFLTCCSVLLIFLFSSSTIQKQVSSS